MNLKQKVPITEILAMTSNDVFKLKKEEFQDPMIVCSDEFHDVVLLSGTCIFMKYSKN